MKIQQQAKHSDHFCFDRFQLKLNQSLKVFNIFSRLPLLLSHIQQWTWRRKVIIFLSIECLSNSKKTGQNFINNDHISSKINQIDIDARFQNVASCSLLCLSSKGHVYTTVKKKHHHHHSHHSHNHHHCCHFHNHLQIPNSDHYKRTYRLILGQLYPHRSELTTAFTAGLLRIWTRRKGRRWLPKGFVPWLPSWRLPVQHKSAHQGCQPSTQAGETWNKSPFFMSWGLCGFQPSIMLYQCNVQNNAKTSNKSIYTDSLYLCTLHKVLRCLVKVVSFSGILSTLCFLQWAWNTGKIQTRRQDREHITQASVRHGNSSHQFYLSLDQRSLFGQWVADSSIQ